MSSVPKSGKQICRYDDGIEDKLEVQLGTTVFVSGRMMFEVLLWGGKA